MNPNRNRTRRIEENNAILFVEHKTPSPVGWKWDENENEENENERDANKVSKSSSVCHAVSRSETKQWPIQTSRVHTMAIPSVARRRNNWSTAFGVSYTFFATLEPIRHLRHHRHVIMHIAWAHVIRTEKYISRLICNILCETESLLAQHLPTTNCREFRMCISVSRPTLCHREQRRRCGLAGWEKNNNHYNGAWTLYW